MALFEFNGMRVKTPGPGKFWVAEDAIVVGNVEIGEDVSIWFQSVVRGDNDLIRIGAGSNIQDDCVLHVDPGFPIHIGEGVAIGHKAMLHGCTIGNGTLIGMGAIVLNGAVIGEQCLIGANTLVGEGKVIPPRSMVLGSPGKVVREMTEKDLDRIARGPGIYRKRWREYAATFKRQVE